MIKYLLDTDICIYLIKKKPLTLWKRFKSFPIGEIGISSITLAELRYGVSKSQNLEKNRLALEAFLVPLSVAPFADNAATGYGIVRADLERRGLVIGPLDMLIAAHALSLQAVLVTNNEREFLRVPELKVENWSVKKSERSDL